MADDFAAKSQPCILYSHRRVDDDRVRLYFRNRGTGVGRLLRIRASVRTRIDIGVPLWVGPQEETYIAIFRKGLQVSNRRSMILNLSLYVMDMGGHIYRNQLRIKLLKVKGEIHCFQLGEVFRSLDQPIKATFRPINWPELPADKLDIREWWVHAADSELDTRAITSPEPEKYGIVEGFAAFLDLVRRLYSHSDTAERTVRGRCLWVAGILIVVFLAPQWWRWIVTIVCAYWVLDVITYLAKVLLVDTGPIPGFRRQMLLFLGNYIIVAGLLSSIYVAWASEFNNLVGPIWGPIFAGTASLTGFGSTYMCPVTPQGHALSSVVSVVGFMMTGLTLAAFIGHLPRRQTFDPKEK